MNCLSVDLLSIFLSRLLMHMHLLVFARLRELLPWRHIYHVRARQRVKTETL